MPPLALVVHCHFYQPPRENPWTEEVDREPSATPFHDWNARIAAECYRPNAFARVLDEQDRVVAIVNNYEHISFDVGPTLTSWLEANEPQAYRRIVEADARGGGGMAQAFFHVILPLAGEREVRTHVRWGMAEFEHRFGRRAEGIWLPETAVNEAVLAVLAEEGLGFTVLAPSQAQRTRPFGREHWDDVSGGRVDTRRPYRWRHPTRPELGVDLVFYDGGLSHLVAFGLGALTSQDFLDRVGSSGGAGGGLVTVAADGETFGHHHHFGDRLLSYALAVEAPRRRLRTTSLARYLDEVRPDHEVAIVESSWSCAHGVERWRSDCGCSTGGDPGWNQQWRAPLREALDLVAAAVDEVFARRGRQVFADRWDALDAYVGVLLGSTDRAAFTAAHVTGDPVEALTLLEAVRHRMAMYTSCGWFFNDLAGIETVQVLRYAARALDCLEDLGEEPALEEILRVLARAESNSATASDGRTIWAGEVARARVDPPRVVAHLALVEVLEHRPRVERVGVYDIDWLEHDHVERADQVVLCSGRVAVTHRRTGRRTGHVFAALHRGGLDLMGATRAADPTRDERELGDLRRAFAEDASYDALAGRAQESFGDRLFDLSSALPDAPEQLLREAAQVLTDRFAVEYDRLFSEHLPTLVMLADTGHPLPAELRAPAELALAHRLENEIAALGTPLEPERYCGAIALARDARAMGLVLEPPAARARLETLLLDAVRKAVDAPADVEPALAALQVTADLGLHPSLERPQELVYDALRATGPAPASGAAPASGLVRLGRALALAVEELGRPG